MAQIVQPRILNARPAHCRTKTILQDSKASTWSLFSPILGKTGCIHCISFRTQFIPGIVFSKAGSGPATKRVSSAWSRE